MNRMPYRTYSSFLKETFGRNVYKVPINIGMSCPNRDGTKSTGGCIYCSSTGSGTGSTRGIHSQIDDFIKGRDGIYIAYFQSYCNMYGDAEILKSLYRDALSHEQVCGISIATRPDTVNRHIAEEIGKLNTYVQIELGLETINEDTLRSINRHDSPESFINACNTIRHFIPHAHIVGHMIVGLPGDRHIDFMQTARMINMHCDGIKLHNLYIEMDMPIYQMFLENKITLMSQREYMCVIRDILNETNSSLIVHRLKSTSNGRKLIAPLWTLNRHFHEEFRHFMESAHK